MRHDVFGLHPELVEVIEAWESLPPAVRTGIVAMVRASGAGWGPSPGAAGR